MKSVAAITFDYRPSRLLAALCLLMMALGLGALWSSQLGRYPLWAAVLSLAAVAAVAVSLWRQWRLPLRRIGWDSDGNWLLLDADLRQQPARLAGWRVLGGIVVLRLAGGGGTAVLPLLPDNLDRDTRRRLRVRLQQLAPAAALPPTLS